MICRFQHNGLCCNSGSMHYEYDCKNCECMIPITNAERIRSMTDEELAEAVIVLQQKALCFICESLGYTPPPPERIHDGDFKSTLDWLRQPYKEET